MAAPRYTNRKTHDCGCTTTWDNHTDDARYETACNTHRRYARQLTLKTMTSEAAQDNAYTTINTLTDTR
jgi:hypothetical protein